MTSTSPVPTDPLRPPSEWLNPNHAIAFLRHVAPEGPWILTALQQDVRVENTRTFSPDTFKDIRGWITQHNLAERNIYFMPNKPKHTLLKKAMKEDIAAAIWLYIDMDPRPDENVSQERERIRHMIASFRLKPTFVIDSGNGYQLLFRLSESLPVDGTGPLTLDVERRGVYLEREFEGAADGCRNIDRILRLPGTINWPNAIKRKRGRVPTLASLVAHNPDAVYSPDAFPLAMDWNGASGGANTAAVLKSLPAEIPRIDVRHLECLRGRGEVVFDRVVAIVENGSTPEYNFNGDRSRAVWHVTCELVRAGASDEEIVSILIDRAYRISDHIHDQKSDPIKYAARQVANVREEISREAMKPLWPDTFQDGRPRSTYSNTRLAIQSLGITCEYDVFHDRQVLGGHAIGGYAGELSDPACAMLRQMIIDVFKFDPGKEHPREAALQLCHENPVDPVRVYMDAQVWDGVARIDTWLARYLGAEDNSLNQAVGRKMLIATVRRVRFPGCKFDQMVVLEGEQGSGKSTALRILAGDENFSDQELLSKDERSQQELLQGVLIYEIGELNGMKKADIDKIKAFITRQVDSTRPAYARFRQDRPRRCILVGTTNARNYLRDPTGNRRFWPVRTGPIDLAALRVDRDQLWAEAAMAEKSGESLLLPSDLIAEMGNEQQNRRVEDLWRDILEPVVGERHGDEVRVSTKYLLTEVLKLGAAQQDIGASQRLAEVMRGLGWDGPRKLRFRGHAQPMRGYSRPFDGTRDGHITDSGPFEDLPF